MKLSFRHLYMYFSAWTLVFLALALQKVQMEKQAPVPDPLSAPLELQSFNYRWSFPLLPRQNSARNFIIIEVGSRDLMDANNLAAHFAATVFAFEGNPDNHPRMRRHNLDKRVEIVESAVSEKDGVVTFLPFNLSLYRNAGAGGLHRIDFTNRDRRDRDFNRSAVQYAVSVPSVRLDTFLTRKGLEKVDVLCMDVQESELQVLQSAGNRLKDFNYIVSEVSTQATYVGGSNFTALHDFLSERGFDFVAFHLSGKREVHRFFPTNIFNRRQEFDVLYKNNKLFS